MTNQEFEDLLNQLLAQFPEDPVDNFFSWTTPYRYKSYLI